MVINRMTTPRQRLPSTNWPEPGTTSESPTGSNPGEDVFEKGFALFMACSLDDRDPFGFLTVDRLKLGVIDLFGQAFENDFTVFEGNGARGVAVHQV